MVIDRELEFTIDLSPARSRGEGGNSELQQALDHLKAEYPLMFIQRDLLNILVSESRMSHRGIRNKGDLMREIDTVDLVVVSKQVKSSRKYGIA